MRRSAGFTLLELVIVIAIIGLLLGAAVIAVGSLTGTKAKEASAELAGTIRLLYDSAALTGRTCRLVFEMPQPKDDDGKVKYHAECAKGALTASRDRDAELKEVERIRKENERNPRRAESDRRYKLMSSDDAPTLQELQAREKDRVEQSAKYDTFATEEVKEKVLPGAVRISVWTKHQRDPIKSGTAYLYFFPQGFTEKSQVVVKQGPNAWTLVTSPLTGKVFIANEELETPKS
jgi:general secretion pathway protein H